MHNPGEHGSRYFNTIKSAIIAVFAGDLYNQRSLMVPVLLFKINFYLIAVLKFRDSLKFLIRKNINMKPNTMP